MEIKIDSIVYCKHGDIELRMGKGLTGLYFKGVEKFVFRTAEMHELGKMIPAALAALKERDSQVKAEFDKLEQTLDALIKPALDKPA